MVANRSKKVKERSLRIRVNEDQYWKLFTYARKKDITMTDVITTYINKLPVPSQTELDEMIDYEND